jgi:hypothetical protein
MAVPRSIATLADGVTDMMMLQTFKTSTVGLLFGASLLGTVVLAQQSTRRANDRASGNQMIVLGQFVPLGPQRERSQTPQPKEFIKRKAIEESPIANDPAKPVDDNTKAAQIEFKTRQIRDRLNQTIEFDGTEFELHELLKTIKKSTTDSTFTGIPIYVDPIGLQEVEKSLTTKVTVLKRASIKEALSFALRQVRLSYIVNDGFLMISSREDITQRRLDDLDQKLERVLRILERLEKVKS